MKKHQSISLLILSVALGYIATVSYGEPLPTDPAARREELRKRIAETSRPKGYVIQPEKTYTHDVTSIIMRNEVVSGAAHTLANVTGKEVFVSYGAQMWTVPDIEIESSRGIVAREIIEKIESIKEADITVIELGSSTLAIIRRDFDPINRQKIKK